MEPTADRKFLILAAVLTVLLVIPVLVHKFSSGEYYSIREKLAQVPSLKIVDLRKASSDPVENILATVRISDQSELTLAHLSEQSFVKADHLMISDFENWRFRIISCVEKEPAPDGKDTLVFWHPSSRSTLDIGRYGNMRGIVTFKLATLNDLVKNYPKLKAAIHDIPAYPNFGKLTDADGYQVYYQKYTADQDSLVKASDKKDCDFRWKMKECRCK